MRSSKDSDLDHPLSLSVLAYNCFLLPYPIDSGQRIRAGLIPAHLAPSFDVLVMCELFDLGLREQVLQGLREQYPHVTAILGHEGRMFNNGGVTIASRWPIISEDRRFFGERQCTGLDCFAEKGVVRATMEKEGRRYHVFGTHAQAGTQPAAGRVRQAQFAMIHDLVTASQIPANEPVLVAGDFNVDSLGHQDEYQQMLDILQADSNLPGGSDGTFDPHGNPLANGSDEELLDHVLWSRAHACPAKGRVEIVKVRTEEPWRDGISDLSDHHALAANFQF